MIHRVEQSTEAESSRVYTSAQLPSSVQFPKYIPLTAAMLPAGTFNLFNLCRAGPSVASVSGLLDRRGNRRRPLWRSRRLFAGACMRHCTAGSRQEPNRFFIYALA